MTGPTLDELKLLSAFADGATLRAAAATLALDKSTLSRQLQRLEERLGEALFLRRGRALTLTRLGAAVVGRARELVQGLDDLGALVEATSDRPLVVSTSPLFAELVLPGVLREVRQRHPRVRIAVQVTQDYGELFDQRLDVAVRRGPLPGSDSLRARRLGDSTMVVVAHPALGLPSAPGDADVRAAPWIRVGSMLEPLRLVLKGRRGTLLVTPALAVDSQRAAVELVSRGVGVARVNEFFVREALGSGRLIEWLPAARSREGVFAVWPRSRRPVPAARTFVQALVAQVPSAGVLDL